MEVANAVVLVTGASGGIGIALAAALREAGAAEVLCPGRRELDVADPESVRRAAARLADRVDILVHAAGVNANRRLFTDGVEATAREEMEVNYFGLLRLAGAFAPPMRSRRRGVIVNILTVLANVNLPLMATYCASKAAAHSLTQALRAELSRDGVLVCGIYPPVVDTAMSRHVPGPKLAPAELATLIVRAIRDDAEDLYPGVAQALVTQYHADPKLVERRMAQRLG
jgi:short-subunit dehydrogenase